MYHRCRYLQPLPPLAHIDACLAVQSPNPLLSALPPLPQVSVTLAVVKLLFRTVKCSISPPINTILLSKYLSFQYSKFLSWHLLERI